MVRKMNGLIKSWETIHMVSTIGGLARIQDQVLDRSGSVESTNRKAETPIAGQQGNGVL
jgi:hypothetical protein